MLPFIVRRVFAKAQRMFGLERPQAQVGDFLITSRTEAARLLGDAGEVGRLFLGHRGRNMHKWTEYLGVYDRWLGPRRGTDVHLLEIGVADGGSLEMWRTFLGEKAVIFGLDLNPACADRVDPPNQVRIGSQADVAFLKSVATEMGRIDVIIDDGSHVASHQKTTFETLFPLLADGGLYVMEDTHTSYWLGYEGGYRRPGTALEEVKSLIDDMHAWYHHHPTSSTARDEIGGIHIHDSIFVIEKRRRERPANIGVPLKS